MPNIVTTITYPTHKNDEVAKTTFEMFTKYPTDNTLGEVLTRCAKSTENGMKVIAILKPKEGKLEECLDLLNKQLLMFFPIEGFESSIELWSTMEEGFANLDLNMPEGF